MIAINCKTEYMLNPIGLDSDSQFLSWNCDGGKFQTAFCIEAYCNGNLLLNTGKIQSDKSYFLMEKKLESRSVITWKVCLWDENDVCGEWCEDNSYEMGLLSREDWEGSAWISHENTIQEDDEALFSDEMNCLARAAFKSKKILATFACGIPKEGI